MSRVKPFRQKRGHCGPACLKIICDFYGVQTTEEELTKLSGCTPEDGVGAEGLIQAARAKGLDGAYKDNSTFEDLRQHVVVKDVPVIVDWFLEDDGHYSVVFEMDKENIYMQDPSKGHKMAMRLETFQKVWFDFLGDFVTPASLIPQRMIYFWKP